MTAPVKNRGIALLVLGLQNCRTTLTEEIVKEAWRKAVKQHHPDTAELRAFEADDKLEQIVTIDTINQARDFLLNNLDGVSDFACKLCQGLGSVASKMGRRTCTACNGTGDKR